MAECVVHDWQGKEAGKASLELKVSKETTAVDLMHRAVLRQQAHSRQGTASTLTRAEVRGGGRKPYITIQSIIFFVFTYCNIYLIHK